jgi:heterodisulfide reductase subunit A
VDITKCIACGVCAEKCPRKVDDAYNEALNKRKAIYVRYPQAVPLKYCIDARSCIFFEKGKCKACEKFCPTGAINFEDRARELTLTVGAVILAPGFETFDPATYDTYGYRRSPNIVTSLEFERILAASGPTRGHLVRPSDQREPTKIAWIQCIGSRDVHAGANPYCSAVCCTHAIKEAMVAKDHATHPLDTAIFYIDVRTSGKDFERYYNRAKDRDGVRFIKSKITHITETNGASGDLLIRYTDEQGRRAEEVFDMAVLSVGFHLPGQWGALAETVGIALDSSQFPDTTGFSPIHTSRPGIFISGCLHSPKDIPSSVTDASAAAANAGALLSEARFSLSKVKELPPEIPALAITGERPRIGVFVCHCGTNIAGVVDVPAVASYAKSLPFVEYVTENLFSCSQDTQEALTTVIEEHKLNRVVVASCSPQTHEPLFQDTVRNAGINRYLFEMANIRNQCSWVHPDEPEAATDKAKDLVRMAVHKVALLEPLEETEIEVTQSALVIGGGIAGMAAAQNLASQGYHTYLIERTERLGGNALRLSQTWKGEDVSLHTRELIDAVETDERIEVLLNAQIKEVEGFVGTFTTTVTVNGHDERALTHGVTIIATGATELTPSEYLYGEDPRVVTSLEFDELLKDHDPRLEDLTTCVFIQCVGSRIPERPYCSRVCCTHSVISALQLKELNPQMQVFVLYRDMRTYGMRELIYREAREKGVMFVKFDHERELRVEKGEGALSVRVTDYTLTRELQVSAGLVVLASALVRPREEPLSKLFKVPVNEDGFFVEAHVKLRPVEFATEGVFVCGLAHSPKSIDESITQAQAAASRAVTLLSKKTITSSGVVARVNPVFCSSCGICVAICPYGAPSFNDKGIAEINPVLCKGCGLCVASCRSGALHLNGFDEAQIMAMINQVSA